MHVHATDTLPNHMILPVAGFLYLPNNDSGVNPFSFHSETAIAVLAYHTLDLIGYFLLAVVFHMISKDNLGVGVGGLSVN